MINSSLRFLITCVLLVLLLPLAAQQKDSGPVVPPIIAPIPSPPSTVIEVPGSPPGTAPTLTLPDNEEPLHPGTVRIMSERIVFSEELGLAEFFGDVTLETETVLIHADEASYNRQTDLAVARGIVSVRTTDGITYWGSALEYDARTRNWQFLDYSTEYPAAYLGAPFIAPVYVNGKNASGLVNGVRATNSVVTTCDLPNPHYYLKSRRVDIYPQDKLIAYDNDLYVLGHRVLHVPWFFLSLKQHRAPIVPDAGWNEQEGYYLRLLYQYVLSPDQLGGIRLDLTTKLGPGIGVDHFYTVPAGFGEAFVYDRQGGVEFVGRLDHTQQLPANILVHFTGDVRQNSRFTLQTTTATNLNLNVQRPTEFSNTVLNLTRRIEKSNYLTDSTTGNLRYDLNHMSWGSLHYSAEYSSISFSGTSNNAAPPDQVLWNRLQIIHPVGFGDLNLRIDHRTDISGPEIVGSNPYVGVQRLPEVYLETDQNRLDMSTLKVLPSRFTVGWGLYNEHAQGTNLARYLFNWQANTAKPICLGFTQLMPTFTFRQTSYGDRDKTAYYFVNPALTATTILGPVTNSITYSKLEAHGFTPFSFDTVYPYELINDNIQFTTPPLRLYLSGGRDLLHGQWQDVSFRSAQQISPSLAWHNMTGYDPNNGKWRDWVSQLNIQQASRFIFKLGTRYSFLDQRLVQVTTELDWTMSPRWRVQWLGGYDGLTRQLTYNEFLIVRDMHCWDTALYVSRQQKMVYLYLRLKAINLPLPFFGISRSGQLIDTTQGIP